MVYVAAFRFVIGLSLAVGFAAVTIAAAPSSNPSDTTEKPAASSRPALVNDWMRAVFQLRVKDGKRNVFATGTGFIVRDDGLAITNYHVIQGATTGTALFEGNKQELPIELWDARPGYDLAIVKIKFNDLSEIPKPLKIAGQEPLLATEVFALGFPDFGFTINRGIVTGTRTYDKFPQSLRRNLGYSDDSLWVQTDCTINPGNSGGPLISAAGEVVGINTWESKSVTNAYFAISISHAKKLIDTIPQQPLTFAGAVRKYGETAAAVGSFPRLFLNQNATPIQVSERITAFAGSITCPKCAGAGTVAVTRQTGSRNEGIMVRPTVDVKREKCGECAGKGHNSQAFKTHSAFLVDLMARLKPEEKSHQRSLEDAGRRLWLLSEKFPQAFNELSFGAAWTAKQRKNPVGAPVILKGTFIDEVGGDGNTLQLVECEGLIYALSKASLIRGSHGEPVVFGGIYSGAFLAGKDLVVPVLQNGFVLGEEIKSK